MIIVGYPGIGKTTLCKKCLKYIDLDPLFNEEETRPEGWERVYVRIAEKLSRDGYIVFVSCHDKVTNLLLYSNETVASISPVVELKEEWIKKLRDRIIESSDEELEKNYRAYIRAKYHFEEDIDRIHNYLRYAGYEYTTVIGSMDYDLETILHGILDELSES